MATRGPTTTDRGLYQRPRKTVTHGDDSGARGADSLDFGARGASDEGATPRRRHARTDGPSRRDSLSPRPSRRIFARRPIPHTRRPGHVPSARRRQAGSQLRHQEPVLTRPGLSPIPVALAGPGPVPDPGRPSRGSPVPRGPTLPAGSAAGNVRPVLRRDGDRSGLGRSSCLRRSNASSFVGAMEGIIPGKTFISSGLRPNRLAPSRKIFSVYTCRLPYHTGLYTHHWHSVQ